MKQVIGWSSLLLIGLSGVALVVFITVVSAFWETQAEEAYETLLPVLEELYGTPTAVGVDADGTPLPIFQPTPNIEAARARFGEGGERLPGGGRVCIRPDGSVFVIMQPKQIIVGPVSPEVEAALEADWDGDEALERVYDERCPAEWR